MIRKLRALDRWALPLGLAGLGLAAWHNWRLWQHDRALLTARAHPAPLPQLEAWPDLPKVSVLVAAWNEAAHIQRHIQSFQALRYPHKELILCAGGEDGTYQLARQYASEPVIVLEQQPGEGKQRALRRCLASSSGAVIFLTDADCMLDDEVFERTLYPIASGDERVVTGGSRPLPAQLENPFIMMQAATQIYHAQRAPAYASGLLGRNGAVERTLLETSGGLQAEAPTGTDYVLAKMLIRNGASIRHIPESRVMTHFPTTLHEYVRQQNRWLRNIVLHGQRFGALAEVRTSLLTSSVGIVMLLLPAAALVLGPTVLAVWIVLVGYAFLSRLRYLRVATTVLGCTLKPHHLAAQVPMILVDFFAWSQPLVSYLSARWRQRW